MTTTTQRRAKAHRVSTSGSGDSGHRANATVATPPTGVPFAAPEETEEAASRRAARLYRLRELVGGLFAQAKRVRLWSWLLLALVTLGYCLFAYQTFLIPQQRDYQPHWFGAQWIAARDQPGNVAYFRKDIALNNTPESAFLTVQASQYVYLYINGFYLGATGGVFTSGAVNRAFIYDVTPFLRAGDNVVAMRAETRDEGITAIRAVLGCSYGQHLITFPSDTSWQATGNSLLVYPPYLPAVSATNASSINITTAWRTSAFDDSTWQKATYYFGALPPAGVLNIDPAVYERPFPSTWLSSGTAPDGFFYRSLLLPDLSSAWLRLASDGAASVYINGQLLIQQAERITNPYLLSDNAQRGVNGISIGLYDITPYLHSGANTLAVHVITSHYDFIAQAPFQRPTMLGIDLLGISDSGQSLYMMGDGAWRVASTSTPNWVNGAGVASWRPGAETDSALVSQYSPYKVLATTQEQPHLETIAPILLITLALLLLGCELALLAHLWRIGLRGALALAVDRLALGFLPTIGVLALLLILSEEPLIPNPFPYTPFWLWVLIGVSLAGQALIIGASWLTEFEWWAATAAHRMGANWQGMRASYQARYRADWLAGADEEQAQAAKIEQGEQDDQGEQDEPKLSVRERLRRLHVRLGYWLTSDWRSTLSWGLVALGTALGFAMTAFGLAYEPYWQDELDTIEVAHSILQDGIPHLATGFIYPKAELYHYELAAVIALFGDSPFATRSLALIAFLATLPLMYFVGSRLFGRRIALVATAILLFSPLELWWAQQARMYQQAQLFVLLVFYLFYKAVQPGARIRYIYLSMGAVVLMYLSHEEGFIVLPAILLYFLATQRLTWLRNKHWWIAGFGAIGIISLQLLIVKVTGQPILGQDISQRPDIGYSPQNLDYYLRLLFNTTSLSSPTYGRYQLTYVSILGFIMCGVALFVRNRVLRYTAAFFFISFLVLTLMFSLKADRYFYPLYPELALLAAAFVVWSMDRLGDLARRRVPAVTARAFVGVCTLLLVVALLASQIPAISNANLAMSRTLGLPFGRQIPDYTQAGEYIQAHWRPGDALLVMAPAVEGQYYVKQEPFTVYLGSSLYIYERGGHILDNYTGGHVLLNRHDLQDVLARYHRVWLLRITGYYQDQANQFQITNYFYVVFETDQMTVYLNTP